MASGCSTRANASSWRWATTPSIGRRARSLARRAGLPSADRITPHSLRHAFATAAREASVALEDVHDAMGHADPRTTRRYDRDRESLDRDPSYRVWQLRVERRRRPPGPGLSE